MIFTKSNLTFRLIDVLEIKGTNIKKYNQSRHFSALSLRQKSNAQIIFDDQVLLMERGSIAYFPPDLNYARMADYDDMIVIHFEVFNYNSNSIETYKTENMDEIQRLFEEIYRVWSTNGRERYYDATVLLYKIFAFILKDCTLTEKSEIRIVSEAKHIMQTEYPNPYLSIKQVADKLNISQEYLRRIFKDNENTSPKKYLQDLRIRRASSLLTSGYYSVKQVAEKCGFMDEKYFSTAFKKATGIQPSKYRYDFNG